MSCLYKCALLTSIFKGTFKETSRARGIYTETSRGSLMGHQRPNQESRNYSDFRRRSSYACRSFLNFLYCPSIIFILSKSWYFAWPEQGEEVEPGDCEGEGPELPLPGPPQPGVQATAVHVDHHQDGRHVADTGCQSSNTRSRSVEESLRSLLWKFDRYNQRRMSITTWKSSKTLRKSLEALTTMMMMETVVCQDSFLIIRLLDTHSHSP